MATYSFQLLVEDDGGEERRAGRAAVKLAHEAGVVAILGAVNSASTHVAARVAAMAGCPQITSVSTDPALTRTNNRWVFRNLSDDVLQAQALAAYLFDTRGYQRVALVHDDNRYGRGGARAIESEAARRGKQLALVREFPRGDLDRAPLASEIAGARPDAVVIWGLYAEAADICKALSVAGVRVPIAGGDGLASPAFLTRAAQAGEGVVVTYPFDPARPENAGFVERYRRAYGTDPDSFASHSYEAAQRVILAVRKVGPDRDKVRAELAAGPAFDATGNATTPVELAVVQNGRFQPIGQGR